MSGHLHIHTGPPARAGSCIASLTYHSEALKGNPLGDPVARPLHVYLPPGYAESKERYSVVYFLPAFMATGVMELNVQPFEETIQERLDRLILADSIPPLLFVMPDFMTRYGGAQYLNSAALGSYSDAVMEVVSIVEAHFRSIPDRDHRVLMGKSSGGYGAMIHGMRYPERFGLVVDHSGDKDFERCYPPIFPRFLERARAHSLEDVLRNPVGCLQRGMYVMDLFFLLSVPAMSAAYSPALGSPLGFDLPLDLQSGHLNEEIWQRWLHHDPLYQVDAAAEALRSLRLLYFDAGNRDEFDLHLCCRAFSKRLSAHTIPHQYEEFEGGHSRTQYRYDVSLKAIASALPSS